MYEIKGVIPAMVTPFSGDFRINEEGVKELVKYLSEAGCHGILVGGTTGEYSLMDFAERKKIFTLAAEAAENEDTAIIANTGCHATRHSIELTQVAQNSGVDAAMILPTYYLQTTISGLKKHYERIADSVDIPLIVYHFPEATNVLLSPEDILELSEIDNIIGVKNTASMQHTSKLINITKEKENFNVLTGYEHLILPVLTSGGKGSIGIVHNIVPGKLLEIYNSIELEDFTRAREINESLKKLYDLMEEEPCPGPVKEALNMKGLPAGSPRSPINSASKKMREKLKNELKKLDLL